MAFLSLKIDPSGKWRSRRRQIVTSIQLISLLATAWMIWTASWVPRLHRQTLGSMLGHVLGYTLLAWAWSAIVATGLYSILPIEDRSELISEVLRTAATAVWFGPAMILLSEFSPAALLAALVLVVYASRLLYAQWLPKISTGLREYKARVAGEFTDCQLPQAFVWRERLPALAVAFCLQAGAVAVAIHFPLMGAAWLCMGTAFLTVFSMSTGAADAGKPPTLPKSILGILATVVLAALLALGSGLERGTGGNGAAGDRAGEPRPSLVESARAVLRQLFYGETPVGPRGTTGAPGPVDPRLPNQPEPSALGGFPGVILWPEIKPTVTLVAPPPAVGSRLLPGKPAQPLSIPFGGEYWMFRWPFAKPPSTSYFQRGTPWKLSFSSTDRTPLQMEAHQKLDTPIDIRCCRAIQVDILNADHYFGTLEVELSLLNTDAKPAQTLWLGSRPVISRPDLARDPVTPMRETLEFTVPAQPSIEQFTEFRVVFQRAMLRRDKSAKVSIDRFLLLPR